MLRVVESNRFEELAAVLAEALATVADPFAPALVAVDNRVVARWVQYAVASANGIAAGYQRYFLDDLVAATLATDTLRALDKPRLEAVLASALADEALLAERVMAEPRAYLAADPDGPSRRRVQLASQVADRYWQYALTRPDWLDAWERGVGADTGPVDDDMAVWQARLWRAVSPGAFVPTPRLASVRRRAGMAAPGGPPVFAIGFSYLPRAYLDTLVYLAEARDVHVLAMSPCAEYWGDVVRPRRARVDSGLRAPLSANGPGDPPALERWGAPGRDYLSSLAELSQGDIDDRFVDATPDATRATARDRWMFDTLVRTPFVASEPRSGESKDAGVRVLACPSVAREVEIVGSEIVRLLAEDPALRANQIAVLLPPSATEPYLGQLPAVFGALGLPFHVVDVPAVGHGHVAEAASLLLQLPLGTFRRPELLGLMTHPAVQARHPHVDPADWVRWADELGIVHGADASDHAGTYLALADHFHWEQGLRRLALGAFMAAGRSDSDTVARTADRTYLPLEVAVDEQPAAATFALLARSLIADARWLRTQRRTLTSWAEVLDALVDAYLGAPGTAGAAELARVRGELAGLAELDLDGRELDFREIQALALRRLGRVRGDRGEPLAHGVHVARLVPHRPLPFPIVFALGLGEEHFPAGDHPGPLDLRRSRRKGDVSPRERDRYAFLEMVLAARDGLYLSYVSREPVTGEARSPSAVVYELAEMLAPYLGLEPDAALDAMRITHPLHRFDASYDDGSLTRSAAPTRTRERQAAQVRATVESVAADGDRAIPPARALRRGIAAAQRLGPVARALGIGLGRDLPPPATDTPLVLRLSALRKFLESAPQGWAQAVLRLEQDDDDDPILRDEEPLALGALERATVARDAFKRYLAGADLGLALARSWDRLTLAGGAPVGVFGKAARDAMTAQVTTWAAELERFGGRDQRWAVFGFGRKPDVLAELLPPIGLDVEVAGGRRRVELVGTTDPWGDGRAGTLIAVPGKMSWRHKLRPCIDHVALAAAGRFQFGSRHLILDKEGAHPAKHERWTPEDARAYLTSLVGELLSRGHDYLLHIDMSNASLEGKSTSPRAPGDDHPGAFGYGPMPARDDLEPPPAEELAEMARRRLGPLKQRLKEES